VDDDDDDGVDDDGVDDGVDDDDVEFSLSLPSIRYFFDMIDSK
tara:strand:+ start:676 stop:804 length:129 start_codon:yes stop_codon:yes gene_type:complete